MKFYTGCSEILMFQLEINVYISKLSWMHIIMNIHEYMNTFQWIHVHCCAEIHESSLSKLISQGLL